MRQRTAILLRFVFLRRPFTLLSAPSEVAAFSLASISIYFYFHFPLHPPPWPIALSTRPPPGILSASNWPSSLPHRARCLSAAQLRLVSSSAGKELLGRHCSTGRRLPLAASCHFVSSRPTSSRRRRAEEEPAKGPTAKRQRETNRERLFVAHDYGSPAHDHALATCCAQQMGSKIIDLIGNQICSPLSCQSAAH